MFTWYAALARRVNASLQSSTMAVLPAGALRAAPLLDAVVCSHRRNTYQPFARLVGSLQVTAGVATVCCAFYGKKLGTQVVSSTILQPQVHLTYP